MVTEETRKKMRKAAIIHWKNPILRKKYLNGRSLRNKKSWKNPMTRKKRIVGIKAACKKRWANPINRRNAGIIQKKNWQNSEYRKKQLKKMGGANFRDINAIRSRIRNRNLKNWKNKNYRKKMKKLMSILTANQWKDPQIRKKRSVGIKKARLEQWKNPSYAKKMAKAFQFKPNKPEKKLNFLLQKYFPKQYKYVGDGKEGDFFGKFPDFINAGKKRKEIIECFGVFWHKKRKNIPYDQTEGGRKKYFAKFGYKTLIVWENEIKDENKVLEKINAFRSL